MYRWMQRMKHLRPKLRVSPAFVTNDCWSRNRRIIVDLWNVVVVANLTMLTTHVSNTKLQMIRNYFFVKIALFMDVTVGQNTMVVKEAYRPPFVRFWSWTLARSTIGTLSYRSVYLRVVKYHPLEKGTREVGSVGNALLICIVTKM